MRKWCLGWRNGQIATAIMLLGLLLTVSNGEGSLELSKTAPSVVKKNVDERVCFGYEHETDPSSSRREAFHLCFLGGETVIAGVHQAVFKLANETRKRVPVLTYASDRCGILGLGHRKLSAQPRSVAICEEVSSLIPLGVAATGIIFFYELARQTLLAVRKDTLFRPEGLWAVLLAGVSIFPVWYNHEVLFLYLNDRWYTLVAVQIFFTLTDDVCLILRWHKTEPELRAVIRIVHVFFNVALERRLKVRSVMFLADDLCALAYIWWLHRRHLRTEHKARVSCGSKSLRGRENPQRPFSVARVLRAIVAVGFIGAACGLLFLTNSSEIT